MSIKHILLPTDGSEFSAGAQRVAIDLAKRCGAKLTVMTIVLTTEDLEGVGTHGLRQQMEQEAQARINAVVAAARAAGVTCETLLTYGEEPHQEIVIAAEDLQPDLVVLGRRGKRGLDRLMVGHATAHVAGNAPCNVLMVPRAGQVWSKRILLATDGSAPSEKAVATAAQVAAQCAVPVTVISATTRSHSEERKAEARAAIHRAEQRLQQNGVTCEGELVEGRPDEVVIEAAAAKGADLIIVGSHGRTGLSRLLLGSISERIMGQAQCPVLIARAAA
jgi:nucleotide-binding universal stress UspA family protein